ncbi:hypothetical protein KC957_03405, partial [Candidatus Saccharibacteria bacterium]|nr:hypothetical protein [Candidatus Saccharibacteria bacterium]
ALLLNLAVLQDGHLLHKSGDFALELNSSGQVKFTVNFGGLNAVAMTAPIVPIDEWVWIEAYVGSDQIPHILVGGAETYYTVQTVGIGSRAASTAALNILSNATQIDADLVEWYVCNEVQDAASCKTDLSWLMECFNYHLGKEMRHRWARELAP